MPPVMMTNAAPTLRMPNKRRAMNEVLHISDAEKPIARKRGVKQMATSSRRCPKSSRPCGENSPARVASVYGQSAWFRLTHHAPILSMRLLLASRQPHHGFFTQFRSIEFAGDAAFVHHERPVGQADDFFQFAGRKQDRHTAGRASSSMSL